MRRNLSPEHLEDAAILAYLDGELSRAATRRAKLHLQSCWKCRYAAAELEQLAQTAYVLLEGRGESDVHLTSTAKDEFFRRKAKIDTTWNDGLRRRISMLSEQALVSFGLAVPSS